MWNNPYHLFAYWNLFSRPQRSAKYDPGVLSTWWFDEAKAAQKRIRELERQLKRADAARAEAAALLNLRKKADAIWGKEEED